ncbi:MAG: hypothetical protein ACOYNL_10655 [Rickettsiales bacterium]
MMMTQQEIEKNLPQLALQIVMERPLEEVAGSQIYSVVEPWQKAELQIHPDVIVARDANAFEAAAASPDAKIIYVPADAAITQSLTRTILLRQSFAKVIIWEGTK